MTENALNAIKKHLAAIDAIVKNAEKDAKFEGAESKYRRQMLREEAEILREKIEADIRGDVFGGYEKYPATIARGHVTVDYDVRGTTTFARLRNRYAVLGDRTPGVAKLSPDDTFDSEIGKVIALHRVLRIPVPRKFIDGE